MSVVWCNGTLAELKDQNFLPCTWLVGVACFALGLFLLIFSCLLRTVWTRKKYKNLINADDDDEDVVWEKKPLSKDVDF
ncbi:protein UL41A [Cercopithecine betaherpesvirus 5]|uniref:Protein UL41A n=1 Tax=Simian cytomegalovirus (strain Colburn) TaxID=50292 RepID=G8XTU6_SCMVC|nr:protein UL41A [Cercopithecine betaherpesvirus 5]